MGDEYFSEKGEYLHSIIAKAVQGIQIILQDHNKAIHTELVHQWVTVCTWCRIVQSEKLPTVSLAPCNCCSTTSRSLCREGTVYMNRAALLYNCMCSHTTVTWWLWTIIMLHSSILLLQPLTLRSHDCHMSTIMWKWLPGGVANLRHWCTSEQYPDSAGWCSCLCPGHQE